MRTYSSTFACNTVILSFSMGTHDEFWFFRLAVPAICLDFIMRADLAPFAGKTVTLIHAMFTFSVVFLCSFSYFRTACDTIMPGLPVNTKTSSITFLTIVLVFVMGALFLELAIRTVIFVFIVNTDTFSVA